MFVYIREAHPTDEWQMDVNVKEGVVFAQPKSADERKSVAGKCSTSLKLSMPVVVDEIDNRVDKLYAAGRSGCSWWTRTGRWPLWGNKARGALSLRKCAGGWRRTSENRASAVSEKVVHSFPHFDKAG